MCAMYAYMQPPNSIHLHSPPSPCCHPRTRHGSSREQLRPHCGRSLPGATAALALLSPPPQGPRGLLTFLRALLGRCSLPRPLLPASPLALSSGRATTPSLQRLHHLLLPPHNSPILAISEPSSVCLVPDVDPPSRSIGPKSPGTWPAQTTRSLPLPQFLPQSIPKSTPVPRP